MGKCSFYRKSESGYATLMGWGLTDTYRAQHPEVEDQFFLGFDYRSKGFDDNRGLRIDLLLASRC